MRYIHLTLLVSRVKLWRLYGLFQSGLSVPFSGSLKSKQENRGLRLGFVENICFRSFQLVTLLQSSEKHSREVIMQVIGSFFQDKSLDFLKEFIDTATLNRGENNDIT